MKVLNLQDWGGTHKLGGKSATSTSQLYHFLILFANLLDHWIPNFDETSRMYFWISQGSELKKEFFPRGFSSLKRSRNHLCEITFLIKLWKTEEQFSLKAILTLLGTIAKRLKRFVRMLQWGRLGPKVHKFTRDLRSNFQSFTLGRSCFCYKVGKKNYHWRDFPQNWHKSTWWATVLTNMLQLVFPAFRAILKTLFWYVCLKNVF